MQLSLKQEHYIETIYELIQDHGHAHVKEIAVKTGVKMASVTEAMQHLSELGLIHYRVRQAVTLTAPGEKIGRELQHRHAVLADFIHTVMGSSAERAEIFACEIEHIVDSQFMDRLSAFVEFLRTRDSDLITEFREQYRRSGSE